MCRIFRKNMWLKWLTVIGISVGLYLLPMESVMTAEIKIFIAVTVGFILSVTFELLPTLLLSMLLPCAYMISGIADASIALSPWTNTLMYLVTAGIILSNVLSDCGLLKRIALTFILKFGGTFNRLVFGLFFACLFMACITFCQGWLLMFTLAIALCKAMGYQAGDKEATVLMMASFCGALTSTVYTYNPAYAPLLEGAYEIAGLSGFYQWYHVYLYMAPYVVVCIVFLWSLIKAYRIEDTAVSKAGREYMVRELERMGTVTTAEKHAAAVLVFLVLYLVTSTWHEQAILYGFIAAVAYLFLPVVRVGKRENVESVNMATIAFMVACMSIGVVGSAVKFDTLIVQMLSAALSERGDYGVLYTLFGLGAIANFVMTPMAILTCLLKPVVQVAATLGVNPVAAIYTLLASVDFYILPYENAWALVFFGLGMIKYKDFVKINVVRSVFLTAAFGLLFIPWWMLLGIV